MKDILIVEDGLHERERLVELFSTNNYAVQSAESVSEAERLLELEQFRLAILDIGLGDKSGSSLFNALKRSSRVPYIIVLTGNPSIHLKQRFLDEGAVDYIVKASAAAENDALLERVKGLLGASTVNETLGIQLDDFLRLCISDEIRPLFLDQNGQAPNCSQCGARDFLVSFSDKTQLPPTVEGRVICSSCGAPMDPKVG